MKQSEADRLMPVVSAEQFKKLFSRDELKNMAKQMGYSFDESPTLIRDDNQHSYALKNERMYAEIATYDANFDNESHVQEALAA
ncbi:hypothetical protein K9853_12320 [Lacticaseibacillus paracasei]|uniref:hypothetical protein n=1 Tax=Lacticaseibacillus paracasei TaxID=1597 RepID=UPI001EDDF708|nr:hypothetical protein [Lacticaseibacillus paracasei]MCG4285480.1 hypothetical protein [Lacticaseibacillus paracasei]